MGPFISADERQKYKEYLVAHVKKRINAVQTEVMEDGDVESSSTFEAVYLNSINEPNELILSTQKRLNGISDKTHIAAAA